MEATRPEAKARPRLLKEASGALGDLGTLLPYLLGAMSVAGMAPLGLLLGFGVFFVASGLFYAIPMAVQPMKLVGAVVLAGELSPGAVAATGLMIGAVMLILGATGAIAPLARLIPQSVTAGLQLGLGLVMALLGAQMMLEAPWFALTILGLLLALLRLPRLPAALIAVAVSILLGWALGLVAPPGRLGLGWTWPSLVLPSWDEVRSGFELAVVPQLPLTLTNAVVVTAILARELFPPEKARRASERNLALTTGFANLGLAPFGAFPMCHGAGGLQAQVRFGATSGLAPVLLGSLLLILALGFSEGAAALFAMIPLPAVGALLVIAGLDLAISRRLFDARADCWPAIGLTALLTLLANPALALVFGWVWETLRRRLVQAFRRPLH